MALGMLAKKFTMMVLFVGFFQGCQGDETELPEFKSGDQSRIKQNQEANAQIDPEVFKTRLLELEDLGAIVAARNNDVSLQLAELFSVKKTLCSMQSSLFHQCIAHTPLSSRVWKQSAVCRSGLSQWNQRKFTVKLRGAQGRFQFILDNSIESTPFEAGNEIEIKWFTSGQRSLRDLKISDIGIFKLRSLDFDLPDKDFLHFEFKIDDKVIFTELDILGSTSTSRSVLFNTQSIRLILSSESCRMEESDIDEATQNATREAEQPGFLDFPKFLIKNNSLEILDDIREWIASTNRETQAKMEAYLAIAADIARLRHDLRGDLQLGCWANEPIRQVEFLIDGDHLPLSDWDRSSTRSPMSTTGNPTRIELSLGGGLTFFNQDESHSPLFRAGGHLIENVTTELTIGDISSIRISKLGRSFQNFENCWSTWGGISKACEWQNRENNRYRLNHLTIKINNETIYSRSNVNHTLDRHALTWFEKDLTANQTYRDIMRRRDCPIH
ncbi:MAG: hypothetical protein RJB13_21 [Pseudomonadota bacterium]